MPVCAWPQVAVLSARGALRSRTAALAHKTYPDMLPQGTVGRQSGSRRLELRCSQPIGTISTGAGGTFYPTGASRGSWGFSCSGFTLARSRYFVSGIYSCQGAAGSILALGLLATAVRRGTREPISRHWSVSFRGRSPAKDAVLVAGQVLPRPGLYGPAGPGLSPCNGGEKLLYPLTLVGRMAFTSYLAQTAIGVFVFYGDRAGVLGGTGTRPAVAAGPQHLHSPGPDVRSLAALFQAGTRGVAVGLPDGRKVQPQPARRLTTRYFQTHQPSLPSDLAQCYIRRLFSGG